MSKSVHDDDKLWGVKDVAEYLGIKKSTAYTTTKSVGFPNPVRLPTRTGAGRGAPRWFPTDVKEWAAKSRSVK